MVDIDVSRTMHCFGVRYFVVLSDNCAYCAGSSKTHDARDYDENNCSARLKTVWLLLLESSVTSDVSLINLKRDVGFSTPSITKVPLKIL